MSTAWPPNWRAYERWEALFERYRIAYGIDRALSIATGLDAATNADLGTWRRLGQKVEKAS